LASAFKITPDPCRNEGSAEKFVDRPTFSLGGTTRTFCPRQKLLHRLDPGLGIFLRRRPVFAELRNNLWPDPAERKSPHNKCARDQTLLRNDRLARPYVARGFCRLAVNLHNASPACSSGKAARFEDAHDPKPFVEAVG